MTRRVTTVLIDDLDGTEIETQQAAPTRFSLDGIDYEIDLSNANRERLADALRPFTGAARKARAARPRNPSERSDGPEIRAWAVENGLLDPERKGRLPTALREAWERARH